MSNDAAALAGWAQNPNAPVQQRLAAAKQALDFYVDQQDQLQQLLEHCESRTADPEGFKLTSEEQAYGDVAKKLRAILGGE